MNLLTFATVLNAGVILAVAIQVGFLIRVGVGAGLIRVPFAGKDA